MQGGGNCGGTLLPSGGSDSDIRDGVYSVVGTGVGCNYSPSKLSLVYSICLGKGTRPSKPLHSSVVVEPHALFFLLLIKT